MGETHQNAIFWRKSILEYTSHADEMVMGLCLLHVTATSVHMLNFLPFSFRLMLELGKRVSMIQMANSSAHAASIDSPIQERGGPPAQVIQ